ncbi:MAG: hypothetical protein QME94_18520, partial [Anaerolineae bacterium]|nr:hypothetical protein [Anaerolineae bacterium]
PLRVLLCLDISGSMTRGPQRQPVLCADQRTPLGVAWHADSPYHHALLAVVLLARALHPRSRLCVLEFGSRTEERIDSEVQDEQGRLMRFGDELFLDGKEFATATRLEVQEVEDWVASQAGKDQVQVVIVTDGGL